MQKTKKELTEEQLHKLPLRITDTTLRDAHQSLWATRMRTDDMLKIIDVMDNAGFYSLESWGGATFDVCLRFLRENPWERLRQLKAKAPKTPLQMLLRGQNLVGYRNYSDDVVDRFVKLSCDNGIDIFRVFDALNDTRNLEAAIKAVKKHGGHAQGTLCYTISPVHTIEKFVEYAREQVAIGVDSICIKDMAGILSPIQAERLVKALVTEVNIPIQLHCHASSGMATATYVEAVRAGAGAIDCAISSMAGFSSQPPVEALAAIFSETKYHANIDMDALARIAQYFADLTPHRKLDRAAQFVIDPQILIHQIPGGMISNFRSQLEAQKALDKLPQALAEVSLVRKDLGYPPLVTPTSQIVGTQAVMNVLAGERYKMVPNEVKDYLRGQYGRTPAPVDPAFIKQILGDEKPITGRPADSIPPMLPTATEGVDAKLITNEEDIISYVIYPAPALEYFKWRAMAPAERPATPAEIEIKKVLDAEAKPAAAPAASASAPVAAAVAPSAAGSTILTSADYQGIGEILARAGALNISGLVIKKGDVELAFSGTGSASVQTVSAASIPAAAPVAAAPAAAPVATPAPVAAAPAAKVEFSASIKAPLVGTFYTTAGPGKPRFVKEGDIVEAGAKVCIVEAMKLFNEIVAPKRCKIVKFLLEEGKPVEKDTPLIGIEEL